MSTRKIRTLIIELISIILLIIGDQYSKYCAVIYLKDKPAIPLIPNVLELNYYGNNGAAFGMLSNQKILFVLVACVILSSIGYVFVKVPEKKKYRSLHICLVFLASGAIGNMIDRIRLSYVVDFISFTAINFPIFNVADIYVTCSTLFLAILLLFVYKENDLNFIGFNPKKYKDINK